MRPYILAITAFFALAILFSQCRPIKHEGTLEVENACVVTDTQQLENMLCILGELRLCRCPSTDPSVQAQCDEFNLPDRAPPEPICE